MLTVHRPEMTMDPARSSARRLLPKGRIRLAVLGGLAVAAIATLTLRQPLLDWLTRAAILANPAPSASVVEDMITGSPTPEDAIVRAWNRGGIVHREVAVREITQWFRPSTALPPSLASILESAALDADLNVRELALGGWRARQHPALPALANHYLRDVDPEVRRMGLDALRQLKLPFVPAAVAPLLNDPEPEIAALAIRVLGRWAGRDFGARLSDAVGQSDPMTGRETIPAEALERLRAAAERARAWWIQEKAANTAVPPLPVPDSLLAASRPRPMGDFELTDLNGTACRLRDQKGRVVLVNFWTTWCTACLGEIPTLIQLRKAHGTDLVIWGISLDALDDEHGHTAGRAGEGAGEADPVAADLQQARQGAGSRSEVRGKVERAVQRLGINYPVLIDDRNVVGARYNGGELPTTLLVDHEGRLCRRFIGPRRLSVLEAMIREARQSGGPP